MKCQVTLRARGAARQWELDQWALVVILAALSADPETFEELAAALRRYQPAHALFEQGRPVAAEDDAISIAAPNAGVFPGEAPWCLIDLVGRTVVAGGGLELPEFGKAHEPGEETAAPLLDDPPWADSRIPSPVVWLDLADTWLFRAADDHWQAVVAARAKAMERQSRIDTRQVLFGFPLLRFLADRVFSVVAAKRPTGKPSLPDPRAQAAQTRKIHADWLMTACDDLGGVTPRQVLLADHDRIQRDLEHRAVQWTMQGFAPPALPCDSAAYGFGSCGTVEVIQYFGLIRALLDAAWRLVKSDRLLAPDMLVQQLTIERDRWLTTPIGQEDANETPAQWIELERRRVPVTGDGLHLDGACPIRQTMSTGQAGPVFHWLDGHPLEMEDEFAFSLTRLRCDWELDRY